MESGSQTVPHRALAGAGVGIPMSRRQQWVYHIEPEAFPPDFAERPDAFRRSAGLTWRGLARQLKVNARTVWRWKVGPPPAPATWFRCSVWPLGWGCCTCCCRRQGMAMIRQRN